MQHWLLEKTRQKTTEQLRGQTSALASGCSLPLSWQGTQPPGLDYVMSTNIEKQVGNDSRRKTKDPDYDIWLLWPGVLGCSPWFFKSCDCCVYVQPKKANSLKRPRSGRAGAAVLVRQLLQMPPLPSMRHWLKLGCSYPHLPWCMPGCYMPTHKLTPFYVGQVEQSLLPVPIKSCYHHHYHSTIPHPGRSAVGFEM